MRRSLSTRSPAPAAPVHQEIRRNRGDASSPRRVCAYAGNQAALRRLSRTTPHIQYKLTVGAANDPHEAEADRVADQVMRMPESAAASSSEPAVVQRKCAACEEEKINRKCAGCEEEEEKNVQKKSDGPAASAGEAPPIVHDVLNSPGQPLDAGTRAFFEPRIGNELSHVRIHADSQGARSAQAISARAYTLGSDVVFAKGEYNPGSWEGKQLLGHELAHVLQQRRESGSETADGLNNPAAGSASVGQSSKRPSTGTELARPAIRLSPSGSPGLDTIFRSESVHPEEQYCEDLSKNSGAPCNAIIECIEDLIEALAGRFSDVQNLGGDEGHWQRIVIVQGILKALMTMAKLACKNNEYDPELEEEAEKWGDKRSPGAPEKQPEKSPSSEEQRKTLRERLPSVPNWVWGLIGAAALALLIACFATGVCEAGAILAAAGEAVGWILINALRLAGALAAA